MKRGVPPTALNARTGELTPPGVTACARSKSAADSRVDATVVGERCQARQSPGHSPPQPAPTTNPVPAPCERARSV